MTVVHQDRALAQQLSEAFVLVSALVTAGLLVTALTYGIGRAWLTPEAERARLASRAEIAAEAAMVNEQTVLEAHVLTRDPGFLESYSRAEVGLAKANDALAAYAGSVSELAEPMFAARLAEERWVERWAKAAADSRKDAIAPSLSEGKALFDAYRTKEAALAAVLDERDETLARRKQQAIAVCAAFVLAAFLGVLLLAFRLHRSLRDSLIVPMATLLRCMASVRDGQLGATVEPSGPRELRQLGEGLNEMVRALAASRDSSMSRDETLRGHSLQLRQILDASREFSESLNLPIRRGGREGEHDGPRRIRPRHRVAHG